MTIDEAIAKISETAKIYREDVEIERGLIKCSEHKSNTISCFIKVAEEHEQLAEWLEELKAVKDGAVFYSNRPIEDIVLEARADAIDECIEMLEHDCFVSGTASKVLIHHLKQLKEQKNEKG